MGPKGGVETDDVSSRNRTVFDRADVVADYSSRHGLFDCEREAFERFVTIGARVLDVGVGSGRTTADLVRRVGAENYIGIDVAPAMIAAAVAAHPGIDLRVGDAAELADLADGSFDVAVFSFNGLDYAHPVEQRRRCIGELRRVLRPGGTLLLGSHEARALLRWLPDARGGILRRLAASVWASARLAGRVLPSASFWRGEGYRRDVARGLVTHAATRRRLRLELAGQGFEHVATWGAHHPSAMPRVAVPWSLHAFRRR